MTTTQIKQELAAYFPLLSERQQEIVLDMVKNLLHIDKKEKRISKEQYNKELEASMQQIRDGKTTEHADVLKQSKQWFKRK